MSGAAGSEGGAPTPPAPVTPAEITAQVLARFDSTPDPRLRRDHARPGRPPARLRHRGRADRGGVGGGDRDAHRDRPHHRREAPGVHPLVGHARGLDAGRRARPPGARAGRPSRPCSGPSTSPGSPLRPYGADIAEQEAGTPAWVHGRVLDLDGDADRRRRARRLAERRQRALRGAGRRRPRRPPARPLPDRRRGPLRLPRGAPRPLPDPRRRAGGADAERDRPPSLAARPRPHRRPRRGLSRASPPTSSTPRASTSTTTPSSP